MIVLFSLGLILLLVKVIFGTAALFTLTAPFWYPTWFAIKYFQSILTPFRSACVIVHLIPIFVFFGHSFYGE